MTESKVLEVKNLSTIFYTEAGIAKAVDNVSFQLNRRETLGIVGESGCGKSVTALSILRLIPEPPGKIENGEILFDGKDILTLDKKELRKIRGNRISMIFQEPMTSLNPVYTIGNQLSEVFKLHHQANRKEALERSIEILQKVGVAAPERRVRDYPHALSGGMRQRVMIAMALACEPDILIADEPTTALDVTIQAQILELIKNLQDDFGMGVIFITHDLGVVAEICDRVLVMYAGSVIEKASAIDLFSHPQHPYTEGLLKSIPRMGSHSKGKLAVIKGLVPDLKDLPDGCRFYDRCSYAQDNCKVARPPLSNDGPGNKGVACFHSLGNGENNE